MWVMNFVFFAFFVVIQKYLLCGGFSARVLHGSNGQKAFGERSARERKRYIPAWVMQS